MRIPKRLIVATILLFAVVTQTTLFGRIRFIAPDLVMLVVILLALTRIRPEVILGTAFLSGLLVDLLGSSLLGLRAIVFTTVAYVALRTKERAENFRFAVALWAGIITFIGVALLVLIGTLFGQTSLLGANVASRVLVVPLANLILAGLFGPLFVRLVDGDTAALRFS